MHFWSDAEHLERRIRLRLGVFVQSYQPEININADNALLSNFIPILEWWQQREVPKGFSNELGPLFAYIGKHQLADRGSGWCVVVLMTYVIDVVLYWLREA